MKPTHFAIILLRVTALGLFVNIAFGITYLPEVMTNVYFARTATAIDYHRMIANMLLLRVALDFFFGLVFLSGARPLANVLVRGL